MVKENTSPFHDNRQSRQSLHTWPAGMTLSHCNINRGNFSFFNCLQLKKACKWHRIPDMNRGLRNFFIILLVLIQFIAPLVHAHTGLPQIGNGIHLPGLEFIGNAQGSSNIAANTLCPGQQGVIINISSGARHKNVVPEELSDVFILSGDLSFTAPVRSKGCILSHRPKHLAKALLYYPPNSPRAPPAQ